MRADPFDRILEELRDARFVNQICVTMGVAPNVEDYREAVRKVSTLGDKALSAIVRVSRSFLEATQKKPARRTRCGRCR